MTARKFTIRYDGETVLNADDIWPMGDAPDDPSPRDVVRVMKEYGDKRKVMSDWNLDWDLEVRVSTNGDGPYPVWFADD